MDDLAKNSTEEWDEFISAPSDFPVPQITNNGRCRHVGPVIQTNLCSCGAQISISHCHRQNQSAVRQEIDFERELDRRHSSPAEKVTAKELKQILAVCEKCVLFENPL